MPTKNDKNVVDIVINDTLPAVFVDNLAVQSRPDNLHLVRFLTGFPEGLKEQVRVMIPNESMTRMLDALCKHCDYFPTKPKKKVPAKKTSARKKTPLSRPKTKKG